MAYTYDDFTKRASDAGMMDRFSKNDLVTATKSPEYGISLLGLLQDSQNAKTGEQKILANEAANQLRKSYGVYSGEDGTAGSFGGQSVNPIAKTGSTGSFVYDNDSVYKQLLESIAKQQPFRYDLETDPSWAAYMKQYLREGDRASANVMAQASAASGGRPSSYAMNVAQQAGNYYAGALSDIIPTLEQDAYTRYLENINNKINGLGALQTDRNFDYENWLNEYNMRQQEYENAMALYKTLGYATPEVAEILGIKAASAESGTRNPGGGTPTPAVDEEPDEADVSEGDYPVDMRSVNSLNRGPIGAAELSKLIESGEVEEYVENGMYRYKNKEKESPFIVPLYDPNQQKNKQLASGSTGQKRPNNKKTTSTNNRANLKKEIDMLI